MEELLTLAKESGVEITAEQAQDLFAQLNQKSGELADDELDNVTGGGCYNGQGNLIVSDFHTCNLWVCKTCGGTVIEMRESGRSKQLVCTNCGTGFSCVNCSYCFSQNGLSLCSNPRYKR